MNRGLLITFEGGEGCGKTTNSNNFCEYLTSLGYQVLHTREPGGTPLSEAVRNLVKEPTFADRTIQSELLLFESARAELCRKVIKPAIKQGKIVVVDRFIDSTTAYQGYGRGIDLEVINTLNHFATDGLTPDLTFYLRIDPQSAFIRKGGKDQDAMEQLSIDFHNRVLNGFDTLAKANPDRIVVIDSNQPLDRVSHDINNTFEERYVQLTKI